MRATCPGHLSRLDLKFLIQAKNPMRVVQCYVSFSISFILENLVFRRRPSVGRCRIKGEIFSPGPGVEPGPLTLRANALTN